MSDERLREIINCMGNCIIPVLSEEEVYEIYWFAILHSRKINNKSI